MKAIYPAMLCMLIFINVAAQNTGINTSNPQEALDVNGAVKIGTTITNNPGTIRYNAGVFEGNTSAGWNAFTQLPAGTLVASSINPNTALSNAGFSFFAPVFINKSATITTTANSWLSVQSFNAPVGRSGHVAAWTGSKMIIWGGASNSSYYNDGGLYDPFTDTWAATSASPLSARFFPSYVWTGTKLLIWGGYNGLALLNDGAAYDPSNDTWSLLSTTNAPTARDLATAVWTGTEMIVWGGNGSSGKVNTGSKYDPVSNTWTVMPTASAPTARYFHTAVWTGSKMIVWGGEDISNTRKNDGGIYDPTANVWNGPTSTVSAPVARYAHSAIWTGTEMIVWGGQDPGAGFFNTGGRYNPVTNLWTSATTTSSAPNIRSSHSAVWTGTEMIVYGGTGPGSSNFTYYSDGGRYNPSSNTWNSVGLTNVPPGRSSHTAVLTANQMIVFGGSDQNGASTVIGGRYILNSESNISVITATALYLFSKD